MKNIRLYFNDLGFEINSSANASFLAKKKGSHFLFLSYTDYYFVKYINNVSVAIIESEHDTSKIIANADFKLPKSLRLSVPNINTVFVVEGDISEAVISFIKKRNVNLVGGQQDSIFILNKFTNEMYCAGKEYSHITGEAKLVWGNNKEFKTLNGHNRSYYLMNELVNYLKE